MTAYLIKPVAMFFPTMILLTIIVFAILRVIPGDPALLILGGEEGDEEFTEEELAALRARLGTDRNIAIQSAYWMGSMLFLDFGESYHYRNPVSEDLAQRIPITLQLTIMSLFISGIVAIPLGVFSAVRQDTWGDYISRAITVIGLATPNFFVGIMTIFLLILLFGWIPPIGYVNVWEEPWANMQQLFFPALALGTSGMAFLARVTRSAMLEVLNEDYIRTAWSKGLGGKIVIYPRPKKCRAAGHHHLRVGVGKRGVRVGGNRDRLFGARHGAAIDRRGPAPGLSDDSGHNRGIRHNGLVSQPINRPDIRLAESPDSLRLIQRRTRGRGMIQRQEEVIAGEPASVIDFKPKQGFAQDVSRFLRTKPLGTVGAVIASVLILVAVYVKFIEPSLGLIADPYKPTVDRINVAPGADAWFGGDKIGRDVFARLINGAWISLYVGILASFIGTTIGMAVGIASAYWGGKLDLIVQRFIDAMIAFPGILLAIAIMAALGASINNVVFALAVAYIPSAARIIRAQALGIKEMDYMLAARAVGVGNLRTMVKYIVPNVFAIYIVITTFHLGGAIIAEASLSFLGVGTPPNEPSWGGMLSGAASQYIAVAWWAPLFPGAAIIIVVFAWNILGDALRDVLDPRLRGTR